MCSIESMLTKANTNHLNIENNKLTSIISKTSLTSMTFHLQLFQHIIRSMWVSLVSGAMLCMTSPSPRALQGCKTVWNWLKMCQMGLWVFSWSSCDEKCSVHCTWVLMPKHKNWFAMICLIAMYKQHNSLQCPTFTWFNIEVIDCTCVCVCACACVYVCNLLLMDNWPGMRLTLLPWKLWLLRKFNFPGDSTAVAMQ